jgi:hypothetical protein
MKYVAEDDMHGAVYYVLDKHNISGEKMVKVFIPNGAKVAYPFAIEVGNDLICMTHKGVKELIEALVKVF